MSDLESGLAIGRLPGTLPETELSAAKASSKGFCNCCDQFQWPHLFVS